MFCPSRAAILPKDIKLCTGFTGCLAHCETSVKDDMTSCAPVYAVSQPAGCFRVTVAGRYKCLWPHVVFELNEAWRKGLHKTQEIILAIFLVV